MKDLAGIVLSVSLLTAATALFFDYAIPDAPLRGNGLAFVAFGWFLFALAARWAWRRSRTKGAQ